MARIVKQSQLPIKKISITWDTIRPGELVYIDEELYLGTLNSDIVAIRVADGCPLRPDINEQYQLIRVTKPITLANDFGV